MNGTLRAALALTGLAVCAACSTPTGTTQPATPTTPTSATAVSWLADDVLTNQGVVTSLTCELATNEDYEREVLVPRGATAPAEGDPCPSDWVELRGPHWQSPDDKKIESNRPTRPKTTTRTTTTTPPPTTTTTTSTTRATTTTRATAARGTRTTP